MSAKKSIYSTILHRSDCTFQIFIGPRGTGKTFSALKGAETGELYDFLPEGLREDAKFIYLRRGQNEVEEISKDFTNPFKSIDREVSIIPSGRMSKFVKEDTVLGYCAPLSTFAKMRGLDMSDCWVTIFDEFIGEKHLVSNKYEGEAFLQYYETVNRNRELEGLPAMRVYLLANAINLNNNILLTLGVVGTIADMIVKKRKRYTDSKRSLYIELMENAAFADAKGDTALYKLANDLNFKKQALENRFDDDVDFLIKKKVNLNEYLPYMQYAEWTIYRHKTNGTMYIAKKKSNAQVKLLHADSDIFYWRFAPTYRLAILTRTVQFDDYATKLVFDSLTTRK